MTPRGSILFLPCMMFASAIGIRTTLGNHQDGYLPVFLAAVIGMMATSTTTSLGFGGSVHREAPAAPAITQMASRQVETTGIRGTCLFCEDKETLQFLRKLALAAVPIPHPRSSH